MGQKKFHQKHLKSSRSLIKVLSIYGSSISLPHVSGIRPSLTWLYQFAFRVKLISGNDQEASKNVAHVKVVKTETKNHLVTFTKVQDNPWYTLKKKTFCRYLWHANLGLHFQTADFYEMSFYHFMKVYCDGGLTTIV